MDSSDTEEEMVSSDIEEDTYEVEEIKDKRKTPNGIEYYVRWKRMLTLLFFKI